jgi:hypothetical protein
LIDVVAEGRTISRCRGVKDLPPSWELEGYFIVVTSFARCMSAMSISETTASWARSDGVGSGRGKRGRDRDMMAWTAVPPLLQLRWLRLVVADEGRTLSHTDCSTNVTRILHRIGAERRWVVAETPPPSSPAKMGLDGKGVGPFDPLLESLRRHLLVLRHPRYGLSAGDLEEDPGERARYLLSVDDERYGYAMSHIQMLSHIDRDPREERFWNFERLAGHEGPLPPGHPRYNGQCPWNVMVVWQGGVGGGGCTTWEPLSSLMKDDPMSCAAYAREHGLLNAAGWKHLRGEGRTRRKRSKRHLRHHDDVVDAMDVRSTATWGGIQDGIRCKDIAARRIVVSILQDHLVTMTAPHRQQPNEDPFSLASMCREIRPPEPAVEIVQSPYKSSPSHVIVE